MQQEMSPQGAVEARGALTQARLGSRKEQMENYIHARQGKRMFTVVHMEITQ